MSDSKYVLFNNSSGPITVRLCKEGDLEKLAQFSSNKRRRMAREIFHTIVVQRNSSMDLVKETGLPIEELKKNRDLQSLINSGKFKVITDTDDPSRDLANNYGKCFIQSVVEKLKEVVPEESKEEVVESPDIIQEEVDPEEIKRAILEESLRIDNEILGGGDDFDYEGEVEVLEKDEKPSPKKRGRKPSKGKK